ncbi:mechanosensitive ion channel family protein [Sulfuricella denitrificans]
MPRLMIALGVLLVGWLIAKALRYSLVKALRALNFNVLTERAGVDGFLQQSGTEKDTTELVGWIVYATALLVSLIIAFNSLGLMQVTDLLSKLLLFVPKILVALLIIVFGSYFARFVGTSVQNYCRGADISDGDLLGRVARYAVLVFVLLLAMDNVEISGGLIQQTFLIILAGFVFAGALAFGLGGRDYAAALLERWFPRDRSDRTP